MSQIEDPFAGRAQIYADQDLYQIRIKSGYPLGLTLFSSFWLIGWAIGFLHALVALLSGPGNLFGWIFLAAWLGAWTVGGLMVIAQTLWGWVGYELLTISRGVLRIERIIPFYRRAWAYDLDVVQKLRSDTKNQSLLRVARNSQSSIFAGKAEGSIKFDYGLHSCGFGLGLDDAEARYLVKELSERLHRG